MKNECVLLVIFSVLGLSSCAFGMGRRQACEAPIIPIRPSYPICVANATGQAFCYQNGQTSEISSKNLVCVTAKDDRANEEWIETLLRACRQ